MMKRFLAAAVAATSLLGAGCIFGRGDYVENAEFDLELPKPAQNAPAVRIGVFRNLSGSDRRFMVRRGDGQVASLEYQRWRLVPELLLMRCVYGAFRVDGADADKTPLLNATVYRFEFDERDGKAHLAVDFTLPDFRPAAGDPSRRSPLAVRVDVAVPVKDPGNAAARAAAMSECARIAVEKLAAGMRK